MSQLTKSDYLDIGVKVYISKFERLVVEYYNGKITPKREKQFYKMERSLGKALSLKWVGKEK